MKKHSKLSLSNKLSSTFIIAIFLIEKVNFPSPEKKFEIDITNEIKKL